MWQKEEKSTMMITPHTVMHIVNSDHKENTISPNLPVKMNEGE